MNVVLFTVANGVLVPNEDRGLLARLDTLVALVEGDQVAAQVTGGA